MHDNPNLSRNHGNYPSNNQQQQQHQPLEPNLSNVGGAQPAPRIINSPGAPGAGANRPAAGLSSNSKPVEGNTNSR